MGFPRQSSSNHCHRRNKMANFNTTGLGDMLKAGSRSLQSVDEAVMSNIEACKDFAAITQTSLGPNGMSKMVVNHLDKIFVTNDAATIIRELDIVHPAANLLMMASQQQEQESGDGTNFVISFAGEGVCDAFGAGIIDPFAT